MNQPAPITASDTFSLNLDQVRDLAPDVLDDEGRLRVLPAVFWATTAPEERQRLGHEHGVYSFPTVELVERLRVLIDGRSAIEIGAGQGVLAEALDIPATDNRMQERPEYHRRIITYNGQAPVRYGPNVIECDASTAVRRYQPEVVIACWITHQYDPRRHAAGGNEIGVDERDVLRHCATFILVGNTWVHRHSRLWTRPHRIEHPDYLYSRSMTGAPEFIATWRGGRRAPSRQGAS